MCTTSCWKDEGIRKSEFAAMDLWSIFMFSARFKTNKYKKLSIIEVIFFYSSSIDKVL